jgi:preprotein translocase subunit SecF
MAFTLPNIYHNRNLKIFVAIPVVMMIIGLYLSRGITLDSTLSGGQSITLQTNTTLSASQIASGITQTTHVLNPSVTVSSGQVSITLAANKTLSDAESYLIAADQYEANYTSALVNTTNYQLILKSDPANQTAQTLLAQSMAVGNSSAAATARYSGLVMSSLAPFGIPASLNASSPTAMVASAQSAYSNASSSYKQMIISGISKVVPFSSYSYQDITVLQSTFFLHELETIIIAAFILISIVVFVIFRSVVPSFAVVFGAANDMVVALGAMALFGIPLGVASIGGLLMLLGYSIDTDVLTAVRILKRREGTAEERAYGSMKTGLTMTATAIVSFAVLFAVSLIAYVPTYYEISGVVLFGLIGDLFTTWLGNASLILLYVKRKESGR